MEYISISGAKEGNLKNISVDLPRNKWIVLTGVSGSGKTTLAMDVLYQECQRQYLEAIGYQGIRKPDIDAIRNVSPAIQIQQQAYNKNPRSTVGTVTDIYTDLRMLYEKLSTRDCPACGKEFSSADCREETEKTADDFKVFQYCPHCAQRMEKLTRTHFSYNTREGACATCQGLGEVMTVAEGRYEGVLPNLWRRMADQKGASKLREAYFESAICPECHGERLNELSRSVTVKGTRLPELSGSSLTGLVDWIRELDANLTHSEQLLAGVYVADLKTKLKRILKLGMGYLSLDRQTMTLSGWEAQRLKLAVELLANRGKKNLYLIDEPTTGLHPLDVEKFLRLLDRMVDSGSTVIVVEHNQQIIAAADWIIDLGPGGGTAGGKVIAEGTPSDIRKDKNSVTGKFI